MWPYYASRDIYIYIFFIIYIYIYVCSYLHIYIYGVHEYMFVSVKHVYIYDHLCDNVYIYICEDIWVHIPSSRSAKYSIMHHYIFAGQRQSDGFSKYHCFPLQTIGFKLALQLLALPTPGPAFTYASTVPTSITILQLPKSAKNPPLILSWLWGKN